MNSRRNILVCAAALAAAGVAAAEEAPRERRIVPLERKAELELELPLPPLARVTATDRSGRTWQQCGEIGGSVEGARADFVGALRARGWQVSKRVTLGRALDRSELLLVTSARRRVLLMVWQKEVGTCGFAWGKET